MTHMLARHTVEDVASWRPSFDGERHAQLEAGLHVKHVWQDMENSKRVFVLFKIEDVARARAFMSVPLPAGSAEIHFHFLQDASA